MIDFSDHNELFKAIKKGNTKAFEYLYKRYYFRLKGYASRFIPGQETVDDIIQECFLTLWEKKEKLRMVSLSSLLFTMVRNSCLNHLKHTAVRNKHLATECSIHEIEERLFYLDFGIDASQKLLHDELSEQLDAVMNHLPERCKEVFVLSRHEGLKNREIAEKLKISITAVEKHISKALAMFSFHLKENYSVDITLFAAFFLSFL